MSSVPNVNFFLGYVDCLRGRNSEDEYLKEHLEERRFYSSNKDNDYVKYVNTGSKEKMDYVEYSGNSEKSHGVFGPNGLMNADELKTLRNNLRNTRSAIWHGVVSFTEEFGNLYCSSYEKAYELMKTQLPKFFKNAGLVPENIEWFAGLHENTDNKHIHLSFFEKTPLRYKRYSKKRVYSEGFIQKNAINTFKVDIEKKLLETTKDIYKQRNSLTQELKTKMELGAFMREIKSLIIIIPTKGRISYDSENMAQIRPHIDLVVNSIIKADKDLLNKFKTFERLISKRDNEIKSAYSKIKVDCSDKLLHDKYMKDIYKRMGNLVIYTLKDIRAEQRKAEYATKNRLLLKRIEKKKRSIMLEKCFQLNTMVNRELINSFQEYLSKLEEVNYARLREEGYLD